MTLDLIVDELRVADVHAGFPDQRLELAQVLLADGVTAADVSLLAEHCRQTVASGSPARVLASLLADPAKRAPRLADLREVAAAKARRAAEACRAFGDRPYQRGPTEGEDRARWARDFNAVVAFALVVVEGKSRATVAADMGVDLDVLEALIARGRELRPRGPRRPLQGGDDGNDEAERRRTFRDQMRFKTPATPAGGRDG
ncbi:MAG: hypothetical protein RJA36_793 [Pseudomonadota bacterium]|jgi:hypothetical protein